MQKLNIKGIEINKENLKKFRKEFIAIILCAVISMSAVFFGYTQGESGPRIADPIEIVSEQMVPMAYSPSIANTKAAIDLSAIEHGGVTIRWLGDSGKELRVQIAGPELTYTYHLNSDGTPEIYPLTDGNGEYIIRVLEQVQGTRYAAVLSVPMQVTLFCEFAPFLRSNQYVNFTPGCQTTLVANTLAGDTALDTINNIYQYVLTNITYDRELAQSVQAGYVPDVNRVLAEKKGICFDYAALTTAMLRSQGLPTRLVVGYAGDLYHAWLDVYTYDTGWVRGMIYFNGETWEMLDPTFAASGSEAANAYITNPDNYHAIYYY